MDRRTFLEDMRTELELQTFNLFPERWHEIYFKDMFPGSISMAQAEAQAELDEEEPVSLDELDDYFNQLGKKRRLTGADVPDTWLEGVGV